MRPEIPPPAKLATIFSVSVKTRFESLPTITFFTPLVSGNWTAVNAPIFTTDEVSPLYRYLGFKVSGRRCWVAFFRYNIGCSSMTSKHPQYSPNLVFCRGVNFENLSSDIFYSLSDSLRGGSGAKDSLNRQASLSVWLQRNPSTPSRIPLFFSTLSGSIYNHHWYTINNTLTRHYYFVLLLLLLRRSVVSTLT